MESHLSPSAALLAISKTLKPSSTTSAAISRLRHQSTINHRRHFARSFSFHRLRHQCSTGASLSSLRYLCAVLLPSRPSFACFSSAASSFSTGGGDGGRRDDVSGGGGGGDGGAEGGDKGVGVADDVGGLSGDVIILDVGGMTCGGCAASVKRILENQPQVFSATVNLTTDTAIVWPVSEAKTAPNWQRQIGEVLAKHLTNCGFESNIRGLGAKEDDIQ